MKAFLKKEWMEQLRSGKILTLGLLFVLFGIMNPAVAKLTPWLMETMADSLAQSGLNVNEVTVSAMDSWVQFFKNVPMALIAFLLLQSNILTKEYQSGTLVLTLTKGLDRYKVIVSKTVVLSVLWSVGYWLCFGVTYGYNAYFWDNSVAQNLAASVLCPWLFGLWTIGLMMLFSVMAKSNTTVLVGTGGVVLLAYLLSLFSKLETFMPTMLMNGNSLIYGSSHPEDYASAISFTIVTSVIAIVISIPIFNKKQL